MKIELDTGEVFKGPDSTVTICAPVYEINSIIFILCSYAELEARLGHTSLAKKLIELSRSLENGVIHGDLMLGETLPRVDNK